MSNNQKHQNNYSAVPTKFRIPIDMLLLPAESDQQKLSKITIQSLLSKSNYTDHKNTFTNIKQNKYNLKCHVYCKKDTSFYNWTENEDNSLLSLYKQGKYGWRYITTRVGRTQRACERRLNELLK